MDIYDTWTEFTDRHQKNSERATMNKNPQFHVVLDIDGTTPPITVASGSEDDYLNNVSRRCKKMADFRKNYRRPDGPKQTVSEVCKEKVKSCCPCDKVSQKKCLTKRFPVWRIMRKYNWKLDLPSDIVAGLTVGVMQLPQGMAYALLAELPPVVGLYMAFFPVLMYFLLGTSRHISMGTVALCSLLTGSVISRFYDPALASIVLGNTTVEDVASNMTSSITDDPIKIELPEEVKINIAVSLTLIVGLVQLAMGFFRMGFITTYMSDPMVGGFTTGAAVHVATSQVKYALGLKIPRSDGTFQIIKTYALIFKHLHETNIPTLIVSLICMAILYTVKVQVNQRFKHKLRFPIPVELFVVIAGTLASHYMKFSENYKMKIVGHIPAGLPEPRIPSMPAVGVYSADGIIIAVVAFSQCVGLAALMAKKHGYSFDSNQELIAYGAGNLFGSFFSCYPYAASVSRSSVQDSAGGKTQLASVVSAILVVIVIVSIGPLFESLPNCVLASIILVALRSLFLQFLELPKIYKTSVYDFLIWVVTFLAVVVLHVDYGILLGMLFSFFTVVLRTQRANVENLQKINEVHVYENSSRYSQTQSVSGVKVVGFASPLYYANAALFAKQVYLLTGITPERRRKQLKKMAANGEVPFEPLTTRNSTLTLVHEPKELGSTLSLDYYDVVQPMPDGNTSPASPNGINGLTGPTSVRYIVLDFSRISFIDTVGAKAISQLVEEYESVKVNVVLSSVNDEVWRVLDVTGFLKNNEDKIFVTVDDAINAQLLENQLSSLSMGKLNHM